MISVWKKLTGKQDEKPIFPSGVLPIGETMQKKYAKGVQYNMKIIIKGDRNTGKSTLFHRLNGKAFREEYIPTHEIQVTNVNWNYQGAADVVKVEVWDIVDKSEKKKTPSDSLKIVNDDDEVQTDPKTPESMALDAEFLNVYKGTHGVILTMDITKAWTWTYIQRELEKIPNRIPVLILANFRDMGERRVVQNDEIIAYIEHLNRPTGSAEVYYSESSMKDGFGLHFAYKYLNMPFLILQRETLLKQLEVNTLEIEETRETLSIHAVNEDGSYTNFTEMLANKDTVCKDTVCKDTVCKDTVCDENKSEGSASVATTPDVENNHTEINPPVAETVSNLQPLPPLAKVEIPGKSLPVATVSPTVHAVAQVQSESIFKKTKKFFTGDNSADKHTDTAAVKDVEETPKDSNGVGDFDTGQLSSDFLDTKPSKHAVNNKQAVNNKADHQDSDDDSDDGNPMVASYADMDSDPELKTFEQQYSMEAEFEDFSDDERQQLEQPNVSIIEKIKAERAAGNRTPETLRKNDDYNDLDCDVNIIYNGDLNGDINNDKCDIESDSYSIQTIESIPSNMENISPASTDIVIDTPSPNFEVMDKMVDKDLPDNVTPSIEKMNSRTSLANSVSNTESNVSEDEDEDNESEPVFVIAGDIDVDNNDAWLVDESSDHEAKATPKNNAIEKAVTNSSTTEPVMNFEIDALEMFMKDQLDKRTNITVEEEPVQSVEVAPTKKKKKKKKAIPEEPVVHTEKKKKKKPTSTTEVRVKSETTPTTKKTKKSKSASSSDVTTSATDTEKEKKSKKVKKKEKGSDLDSFYEGL